MPGIFYFIPNFKLKHLELHIEAILFAADSPVSLNDLGTFISKNFGLELAEEELDSIISSISNKFIGESSAFELIESGGGFQFRTKSLHHDVVAAFLQRNTVKRLTGAALETLAIVAYKQPVTKSEMESIRGVSCDYTIQKLMERELVEIKGRSNEVGRPLLYGTTNHFLDYFGINHVGDLPKLKEFTEPENQIGEKENIINNQ